MELLKKKTQKQKKICPICKSTSDEFVNIGEHTIYKCVKCGFGFTDQLKEHLGEYHRDSDYIQEENLFRNIFQKRVKKIKRFIKSGKVLEVGCSTGLMASLLQNEGFELVGIEISKKAALKAEERGVKVFTIPFEKFKTNEKFDLIILNHTLEHLQNPVQLLRKIRSLLTPKGYLYIDLPNFDSFSAKIKKGRWSLLLPDEHLWHFTEKAFTKIFKELDFKIVFTEKASGVWDFDNPFLELWQALKSRKKRFFGEFFTAIPSLFITKSKRGTDLMIIARRK